MQTVLNTYLRKLELRGHLNTDAQARDRTRNFLITFPKKLKNLIYIYMYIYIYIYILGKPRHDESFAKICQTKDINILGQTVKPSFDNFFG